MTTIQKYIKVQGPSWQPPKNKLLDTFFDEHKSIIGGHVNNIDVDHVEMVAWHMLSLVPNKADREKIENSYDGYVDEFKNRRLKFKRELNTQDERQCVALACEKMLGDITDTTNKYLPIEGMEKKLCCLGGDGYDLDGNKITVVSEKLAKTLAKEEITEIIATNEQNIGEAEDNGNGI